MLFFISTSVASTVFANPSDSVTIAASPGICINNGPVTLTATLHVVNPAGAIYQWQFWQDTVWVDVLDSTRSQLVVPSIPNYSEGYHVKVTLPTHVYTSNNLTVCHCTVVPIVVRQFTANTLPSGKVQLQFVFEQIGTKLPIMLQQSADTYTWTDVADVTGKRVYTTPDAILGTVYYRLKWILPDGSVRASVVQTVHTNTTGKINLQKPFTVTVTELGTGRVVNAMNGITSPFPTPLAYAQQFAKGFIVKAIYVFQFIQQDSSETIEVPK